MRRFLTPLFALQAAPVWACPFCNVDAAASKQFILLVIGLAITCFVMLLGWAIGSGQFKDVEDVKYRVLELDASTSVRI